MEMKLQICDRCQKNVYELYAEGRKKLCKECAIELSTKDYFKLGAAELIRISQEILKLEKEYRDTEIKIDDFIDDFCHYNYVDSVCKI